MIEQSNFEKIIISTSIILFLTKLWIYIYMFGFDSYLFIGGDSDYYHQYAIGEVSGEAANYWPVILNVLNSYGLYSRYILTILIMSTSLVFLPVMAAFLIWMVTKSRILTVLMFIYSTIYPTQILYSFDIYRDLIMVVIFIVTIITFYLYFECKCLIEKTFILMVFFAFSVSLTLLRPYLGGAVLSAFLFMIFYPTRICSMKFIFLFYTILIFFIFKIGFFDLLINYRSSFSIMGGGSNLNVRMDGASFISFLILLFKSFGYQILGGYFVKVESIILFLIESLPIILSFVYIFGNLKHANKFSYSMIVFFVIYSTIWLIGTDNFGTGMRLRIYSYYSLLICAGSIYRNKIIGVSSV